MLTAGLGLGVGAHDAAGGLGLDVDGLRGQVTFSNPMLPAFLDVVHIEGLRVGRSRVDLRVHRYADGAAGVDVVRARAR